MNYYREKSYNYYPDTGDIKADKAVSKLRSAFVKGCMVTNAENAEYGKRQDKRIKELETEIKKLKKNGA